MKTAKDVYDTVQSALRSKGLHELRGELITGNIHILNISEEQPYEWKHNDIRYRVYHSDGYCFDVERTYVDCYEDEILGFRFKSEDSFAYEVFPEVWDGFKNKDALSIDKCIELLEPLLDNGIII